MRHRIRQPAGRAFFAGLLFAATLWGEGTQNGVLAGRVVDATEQPLPDVEVKLVGLQADRQALTDDEGRFRFPALAVGTYEVTADLLGLVARSNVRIFIDKTTEVTLELSESSPAEPGDSEVREAIQVLAVAPLIDRYDTSLGTSVSRDFLAELPIARIYQSVALLLPGVAGGDDGNPNVSGALRGSNLFLIDGVDTTDSTTGLFGLNLSYEAVQDVGVTTAAPPSEYGRVSGAVINVVTRSGDDRFRGSLRWLLTNNAWNSDYEDPAELLAPELAAANRSDSELDNTLAATLAGPLQPKHLWFFAAFEQAESTFLRPALDGSLWDEDTDIQSSALKLTAQTHRHSLVGQLTADSATFATFAAFDRSPGENRANRAPSRLRGGFVDRLPGDLFALQDREQDGEFFTLQWTGTLSQGFTLSANAAAQDRRLDRTLRNNRGITSGAPHFAAAPFDVSVLGDEERADFEPIFTVYNGLTDAGFEERDRDQANLTTNVFWRWGRADHELRFGVDYQRTRSLQALNVSGQQGIDAASGRAVEGQIFIDDDGRAACLGLGRCTDFDPATGVFQPYILLNFWHRPARWTESEIASIFVNEGISIGRWFLSLGARFESVRGEEDTGRRLVESDALAPRIGVKYDPKGDGRALLSATWSRFHEPFLQQYLDDYTLDEPFSGYSEYDWDDGRFDPACAESGDPSDINSPCWVLFDTVPFFPFQTAEPNLSLARAAVDELVVAFEREINSQTSLRLSWVDRRWRDLWDDLPRLVAPDPDDPDADLFFTTTIDNLSAAQRTYRGLQLQLQKRFADRWQMLASYTWSEAEGNLFQANGRASFADFPGQTDANFTNRSGPAPFDRRHQLKIFANIQQPLAWTHLSLGTVLQYETGTPYQQEQFEEFGLRFVTPRGSLRLDDFWQWDVSAALDFAFAAVDVELKVEIFNVTDEQNRTGVETLVDTGDFGLPRSIADLQVPRNVRLTLGVRF